MKTIGQNGSVGTRHLIKDVKIKSLKKIINVRGGLQEVQKNDDEIFPGFGQAYITTTLPGIIKAWYYHHQQVDQIALIKGMMKLVLYDVRENSATFQQLNEILVNENQPQLIQIPNGIWHGFQAVLPYELILLHLNTMAFKEGEAHDEDRIPSDDPLIPYQW